MDRTLLQQLYGGVTSPGQLHGFVDNLARAVGCHSGSLTVRDLARGTHVSLVAAGSMADPRTVERFNQESSYTRDNLWLARSAPLIKTGAVVVSDDAATIEEMRPTRYYKDFLHQIDTLHSIAMCATVTPGSLTMMTFVGSEQRGNFTQAERALCQSLAPPLGQRPFPPPSLPARLEATRNACHAASGPTTARDVHQRRRGGPFAVPRPARKARHGS